MGKKSNSVISNIMTSLNKRNYWAIFSATFVAWIVALAFFLPDGDVSQDNEVAFPIWTAHPKGRQPKEMDNELEFYSSARARSSWATMNNAYWHLLNVRNAQPHGGYGSIGD